MSFVKSVLFEEGSTIENLIDNEDLEIHLGDAELNQGMLTRLARAAQLMTELYTAENTSLDFPEHRRSITEFKGGYKIAIQRGAPINNFKVFNLFFRIKSNRINSIEGQPVAQMYTTKQGERLILLHPDNTAARIESEKTFYFNKTLQLVSKGRVEQTVLDELIQGMQLLNIHERCAQTLIHEYGHILHWRSFDHLFNEFNIPNTYPEHIISSPIMNFGILSWFEKHNYIYNVADRVPGFKMMNLQQKLLILKESFVEDYRNSLNIQSTSGKIILPNAYCVVGDLMKPELGREGMRIVNIMLDEAAQRKSTNSRTGPMALDQDMERNRVMVSSYFFDTAINSDWEPGKDSLSKSELEHMKTELIINSLRTHGEAILEVAAAAAQSIGTKFNDHFEKNSKRF
jgi:hypothetical protein